MQGNKEIFCKKYSKQENNKSSKISCFEDEIVFTAKYFLNFTKKWN
jgi:hypothetical protein